MFNIPQLAGHQALVIPESDGMFCVTFQNEVNHSDFPSLSADKKTDLVFFAKLFLRSAGVCTLLYMRAYMCFLCVLRDQ